METAFKKVFKITSTSFEVLNGFINKFLFYVFKMEKRVLLISVVMLLLAVVFVSALVLFYPYNPMSPPKVNSSGWTQQGVNEVVDGNNQFAIKLYKELESENQGNLFFSPYSIYSAMAMVYEGARGKTAKEIKNVFHFPDYNVLRPNFAKVYTDINAANKNYTLRTGNALWVERTFNLLPDYTRTVEEYYGGKAVNLDFINEPEKSRQTINSFIAKQTNDKIKDLIPSGMITPNTKVVLTDSVYFKGIWKYKFDKKKTFSGDFKITPSEKVNVPMMIMEGEWLNYADLGDLQMLELPYKGDKISMIILLPVGNLSSIESNLTAENLKEWEGKMNRVVLKEVEIPKFKFSSKYFMRNDLVKLGMPTAFSDSADFSGMDGRRDLLIDQVIHQTYIEVNEEKTEAAAATAVTVGATAIDRPIPKIKFIADHPFIFLIQQKDTGNILFIGRVVDPRKSQ